MSSMFCRSRTFIIIIIIIIKCVTVTKWTIAVKRLPMPFHRADDRFSASFWYRHQAAAAAAGTVVKHDESVYIPMEAVQTASTYAPQRTWMKWILLNRTRRVIVRNLALEELCSDRLMIIQHVVMNSVDGLDLSVQQSYRKERTACLTLYCN